MNEPEPQRPRIVPAVARIDKTHKPTKQQKLAQRRKAAAWKEKASRPPQELDATNNPERTTT